VCPFSYAYHDKIVVINEQDVKQSLTDIQPRPESRAAYTADATPSRRIHGEMEMGGENSVEFESNFVMEKSGSGS
jgi:hypothetical protein